jgi:hypothetical protein
MKKLILLLLAACPLLAPAQNNPSQKDMTDAYVKKYPEDQAVYLSRTEYNTIKVEKGQLRVYTKNHSDLLLLSDKVSGYSERQVYYSSFSEISSVSGKSMIPNGRGGYTSIPVKEKYETNEFSSGSFYDDFRAQNLVFTGLTRGGRILLDYTEKLSEARFFGRFFFSTGVPTEDAVFTVEVPKGVTIEWKLFNISESDLEMSTQVSKKKTIYTWRRRNSPKYKTEDDAPGSLYFAPHIVVYIKEYIVKGKVIKVLDGPGSLYEWYFSMVKDVNKEPDPALQKVVDSLIVGAPEELTKVKRIFYWVQDNIKYVAFEDGMGGFVPREANAICSRRYGDCKDMASITTTMLRMAGIPAYLTWIGTRSIPYKYLEVPSPMADNHMICTYISNGEYYFLDATGKNAPFGTPTSMIQGKQALISKGEGKFEIITVPVIPETMNSRVDSTFMRVDEHFNVTGSGSMRAAGYQKIHLTYPLDGTTEKEKHEFFKSYLRKGTNKFAIDTFSCKHLYDRDENLFVDYEYSIGGYAHKNGEEIYVNMQLDKSYENQFLDSAERTAPMEIDYKSMETYVSVLTVPEGYAAGCLPADSKFDCGDYAFEITYRQEGNKIICTKKIWIRTLMVQPSQFAQWNEFVTRLTEAYNQNVTLHKVTPAPAPVIKKKK